MGANQDELEVPVRRVTAIRAAHHGIVAFFPACLTIQVNDDEIAFHRA
ncbi:hypothetical protein MTBBW1_2010010 [Desulfamplus magnetovallimortis]|uniref:Uncharacterized protein n=1 Tax=Desulfamplus magnetovallimortis TaxID=1246637 RepID=A0A1W1HBM0_9BACT|nr:hypothetical protein [Desulfamplus magnetovallimortis]SLM29901.1 hypothetical protein MTBBW1_2010010 [Desulfamplus magnetovallimortis]